MGTYSKWEKEGRSLHATEKLVTKPSRRYPRITVSVPVMVFSRGEEFRGKIVDLSLTGAFILLPQLPDLTRRLELYIKIPNMHVVFVIGAIVRFDVRPVGDGSAHHYGLAVHFLNISDEDRLSLSYLLKRSLLTSAPGMLRGPTPCLMGVGRGRISVRRLQEKFPA
jgi:hypothetical protein